MPLNHFLLDPSELLRMMNKHDGDWQLATIGMHRNQLMCIIHPPERGSFVGNVSTEHS